MSHAEAIHVAEAIATTQPSSSVRLVGTLKHLNRAAATADLMPTPPTPATLDARDAASVDAAALRLDLTHVLADTGWLANGELVMLIGELVRHADDAPGAPLLRARILRSVRGLDVELYGRCVAARRELLRAFQEGGLTSENGLALRSASAQGV